VGYGRLCEAIGMHSSTIRSLLTVQNMVAHAVLRWASPDVRLELLPRLASGESIAAFCLSEADVGSDAASVTLEITPDHESFVLSGTKLWVTFGQLADVLLVVGRSAEGPTAVIVRASDRGVRVDPAEYGLLGLRGAMLATIALESCVVPRDRLLAVPGAGFSHVAALALDHGRFSIAYGCVGIAQRCLDAAAAHARTRRQFGKRLEEHQLVRRLLSDMAVDVRAARLMCGAAAAARERMSPSAPLETMAAKYFAAQAALRSASDAIEILGALGCTTLADVERHFRDAKVMQIIEGTEEIHQLALADLPLRAL